MNEFILKLIERCMEINRTTEHTVFFDFYGHVNKIDIRVYCDGWRSGMDPTYQFELNFDEEYAWLHAYANAMECLDKVEVK